jgi:hypothetical protein
MKRIIYYLIGFVVIIIILEIYLWFGRKTVSENEIFTEDLHKNLVEIDYWDGERGYGRLEWWCLDWNKPSIDFYLSLGAEPMNDWTVYRIAGINEYGKRVMDGSYFSRLWANRTPHYFFEIK